MWSSLVNEEFLQCGLATDLAIFKCVCSFPVYRYGCCVWTFGMVMLKISLITGQWLNVRLVLYV